MTLILTNHEKKSYVSKTLSLSLLELTKDQFLHVGSNKTLQPKLREVVTGLFFCAWFHESECQDFVQYRPTVMLVFYKSEEICFNSDCTCLCFAVHKYSHEITFTSYCLFSFVEEDMKDLQILRKKFQNVRTETHMPILWLDFSLHCTGQGALAFSSYINVGVFVGQMSGFQLMQKGSTYCKECSI